MKLAIVIPWFGRDLKGGAEQQAWELAARLARRRHAVEVLTTCCRSHQDDWVTNHLAAGSITEPEGFTVRRFPVEPRDRVSFDHVCGRLLSLAPASLIPGVSPIPFEEASVFIDQLIRSPELQAFLIENKSNFDAFILLPYLYGPIIHGVHAVAERAYLQPCLHDEAYAYLPQVADAFYAARAILFNSEGEAELATRLYGPAIAAKGIVVGEGVEVTAPNPQADAEPSNNRFVLYLGRKEAGKNTDMLVRAFTRFRRVRPNSQLRLVLAGHGRVELNGAADWITDLGVVTNAEKENLLRDCLALAQPSINESFSRAMMEAWRHGKPVAVNGGCLATSIEVNRCSGGWAPTAEDDWAAWFVELDRTNADRLRELGTSGRKHAESLSDWEGVIDRYEQALTAPVANRHQSRHGARSVAINQFLPNLSYGDAISNEAIFIRDELRALGYRSEIYVRFIDPRVAGECSAFSTDALGGSDAIIYHHSIGTEITPHVVAYRGPKCLIYHNITPAEFVEPYRPAFAEILRQGRRDLSKLAPDFDLFYGDSTYNAAELAASGFDHPGVLPICVDPTKWSFRPDGQLMAELSDHRTNIIFVGRIAPNKKQDDLVRAFSCYLALDPGARLCLVGTVEQRDPYADHLFAEIQKLGLSRSVHVTGNISNAQLAAYYRTAHLFWSMSEHEGFCVPLIEAMWFDIPVLAFQSCATPETLGQAALMFNCKSDLNQQAALAYMLICDHSVRRTIITAQRRQRTCYLPASVKPTIRSIATQLVHRLGDRRDSVQMSDAAISTARIIPQRRSSNGPLTV